MRLALLVTFLVTAPTQAMQQAVSPAELCAHSPLVVEAEVTGHQGMWNDSLIETHHDLHVHKVFKGELKQDSVTVVVPGGTAGGVTLSISESPTLRNDHRYVLLLTTRPDGAWTVSGGPQGVFALTGAEAVPMDVLRKSLGACHVR